ncbi:MAG: MerR family transcriptional regulator [Acetivibrio sp.]
MDKNKYLTTGEFAKIMNVTKNTLFHYDKIGLFSPEIKLQNEYRYYSFYQMEIFDVILILKDLGMSLADIKNYIDNRSMESILELLDKEEEIILGKIKKLKKQKIWIQEQRKNMKELYKINLHQVSIQEIPEQYYFLEHSESTDDLDFSFKIGEMLKKYNTAGLSAGYKVGYLQYNENIANGNYLDCHDVILVMKQKADGFDYKTLQGGKYVTAYHLGHWNQIGETYEKIKAYIKSRHLHVDTRYFEISVVDKLLVEEYEDYVTQILVQIKKNESKWVEV